MVLAANFPDRFKEALALMQAGNLERCAERRVFGADHADVGGNGTAKVLGDILSILDPAAFGLGEKLRDCMRPYARYLRIAQTWDLELAAMLSQIGYVTIPASVLAKHRAGLSLKAEEKDMLARDHG
jgi:hypothetical protein